MKLSLFLIIAICISCTEVKETKVIDHTPLPEPEVDVLDTPSSINYHRYSNYESFDTSRLLRIGKGAYVFRKDSFSFGMVFEPNFSPGDQMIIKDVKQIAITEYKYVLSHFSAADQSNQMCVISKTAFGEWRRKYSCCYYPGEFKRHRIKEFYFSAHDLTIINDSMIDVRDIWYKSVH